MVLCPAPPSVPGAGAGTVTGAVRRPGVCTGGGLVASWAGARVT